MKEAYRLHRRILLDQVTGADQQVLMIFVYQAREELSYPSIEKAIIKALRKMAQEIQPNSPENPVP